MLYLLYQGGNAENQPAFLREPYWEMVILQVEGNFLEKNGEMKSADINTNLIDHYYTLLKSLKPDSKLELISRLSKSMKTTKKAKDESRRSLFGALKIDQSADEFVEGLQNDRNFNRKPVGF